MLTAVQQSLRPPLTWTSAERSCFWFQSFVSFVSSTGKFMCLHFIRTRLFFLCFIRIWLVRLAARAFGVRQCVPYIENIFIIFSLSFSRFRFTWFSYTFNFLFRRFFVVKHITFNGSIVLGCAVVRWMGQMLLCSAYVVSVLANSASLKNRFRYCFLSTSVAFTYRRIRSNGILCARNFRHSSTGLAYTFLLRARQSIPSMVFYWIRSLHRKRNGMKKNKDVSQIHFEEFVYVYRFVEITHFFWQMMSGVARTNVWNKGFQLLSALPKWHIISFIKFMGFSSYVM